MTALFRHLISHQGRGRVKVTVYPNDGRTFADDFMVDAAELRRFCWAVLADLEPAAAREAAAAEGADLATLTATDRVPRPGVYRRERAVSAKARERVRSGLYLSSDTPQGRALLLIAPRPAGISAHDLERALGPLPNARGWRDALDSLVKRRLVTAERLAKPTPTGARKVYVATDAGRYEARLLAEKLPEAA